MDGFSLFCCDETKTRIIPIEAKRLKGERKVFVEFKKLYDEAIVPTRATDGSAGYDLYVSKLSDETKKDCYIGRGETVMLGTGIAVAIPKGYVGLILARNGLAINSGLAPASKVTVIDSDYRGEVKVALLNHSRNVGKVSVGDRVAQMIVVPIASVVFVETDELPETERGEGGLGSTGK